MMQYVCTFILLLGWFSLFGQPSTEVWLFDLNQDGKLSAPRNISDNPGYDNQPSFTSDGQQVLFASTRNEQTDIISYRVSDASKTWLTSTPGGEYSPTQIPNSDEFSAVLLQTDGRQLVWKYSLERNRGNIAVPILKIGYFAWVDQQTLFAFVLGPHSTFQKIDLEEQRAEIVQENIGRSIHYLKESQEVFFVDKNSSSPMIMAYHVPSDTARNVGTVVGASEDMAVTMSGMIYMGDGDQLFRRNGLKNDEWKLVEDLSRHGLHGISRLSISPNEEKIAIVVNQ